jgi:Fe-S-cluster-containing dehydrogenase component
MSAKRWNLVIDVPLCENCNNCVLASKDELVGNTFPGYTAPHAPHGPGVVRIRRKVRGQAPMVDAAYMPVLCNHCDDAPCIRAAGSDVIRKREDGIVVINPVRAKGRSDLVDACPYGAIVWNEAEQLPQNWFFDAHLLDSGWPEPRIAGVCPTRAIEAVKVSDEDMAERVARDGLRTLNPEWNTQPRVHYRHLERFDRCFIGGSASAVIDGKIECISGARAELRSTDGSAISVVSDAFGDFRFDGLAPDSGAYELVVLHELHGRAGRTVSLAAESIYLGELRLEPG